MCCAHILEIGPGRQNLILLETKDEDAEEYAPIAGEEDKTDSWHSKETWVDQKLVHESELGDEPWNPPVDSTANRIFTVGGRNHDETGADGNAT